MEFNRPFKLLVLVQVVLIVPKIGLGKELIFSNWVWRHGDRSYMQTYPNDPYKDKNIWKNGPGQLTNIGMKEQYDLGQYLRIKYNGFLSREYLRKEIYLRSTDKDRTIMSAQSNMAGLYPVTADEMWNGSNTNWHPIPVHVIPLEEDHLLRYPQTDCQKYLDIVKKIRTSPWFQNHEKKFSPFYDMVSKEAGKQYNLTNIWEIEDNLFCLWSNNFTLPLWVSDSVLETLKHLNSLEMGLMFTDINYRYRKEISPMQGGILLKKIIQNMKDRVSGKSNTSVIAYSAHDTTLTALLVSLGNYDWIQPSYASCIMVDLYQEGDHFYVELYYRRGNGTVTQLQFEDCKESCNLQAFESKSQDLIPGDNICPGKSESSHALCDKIFLILALLLFVALILTIAAFVYGCKASKKTSKYSPLPDRDIF